MAEFRIQRIEESNGMVDVRFVPSSATSLTFSAVTSNTYYGDGSNLTGISTIDTYVTGFTFKDRKSTRLNSSHVRTSRMPSSA